jgi:hypothetical protein
VVDVMAHDLDLLLDDSLDDNFKADVRCMAAHGQRGYGRCPEAATRIAVTWGTVPMHLVIQVCDTHADALPPGWEIVLNRGAGQ